VFVKATGTGVLTYEVPSLHVTVTTTGPLRHHVMNTLSRSPRVFALAPGPAPAVPSSWRWISFADVRFAVPTSWSLTRTDTFIPGCGPTPTTLLAQGGMATLDTDKHIAFTACPFLPAQQATEPVSGVVVDSGFTDFFGSPPGRCLPLKLASARGISICEDSALPYSVLMLKVTVPGRAKPVIVSIGLAGNGMVARTILYSLTSLSGASG
jgi:hypothetical protein